jgi:hypothetical protein
VLAYLRIRAGIADSDGLWLKQDSTRDSQYYFSLDADLCPRLWNPASIVNFLESSHPNRPRPIGRRAHYLRTDAVKACNAGISEV